MKTPKVAMIVAHDGFRDEEYLLPRDVLAAAGAKITTFSSRPGHAHGMLGARVCVDETLEALDVDGYDAVVFIGGDGSAEYFSNPTALGRAAAAVEAGKVVGAICIAPGVLARAGVLRGRSATSYVSEAKTLQANGARYTARDVEVDGDLVTASGPHASRAFGEAVRAALELRGVPPRNGP
jgi:protease I